MEAKPKRKFINPKGKKFKKPNQLSFFSSYQLFFFQIFAIFLLQTQNSGQKTDGRFYYVCGRTNHLTAQCFNWKMEPVKAQPRGNGENGGHKVNMVELNSNSFRLDFSLSIVIFIAFSLDRRLNMSEHLFHSITRNFRPLELIHSDV